MLSTEFVIENVFAFVERGVASKRGRKRIVVVRPPDDPEDNKASDRENDRTGPLIVHQRPEHLRVGLAPDPVAGKLVITNRNVRRVRDAATFIKGGMPAEVCGKAQQEYTHRPDKSRGTVCKPFSDLPAGARVFGRVRECE